MEKKNLNKENLEEVSGGLYASDSLTKEPVTSVDHALQGRAAGVQVVATSGQPGADISIRVRGTSSLSASNNPLIVVDGMKMDNDGIVGRS